MSESLVRIFPPRFTVQAADPVIHGIRGWLVACVGYDGRARGLFVAAGNTDADRFDRAIGVIQMETAKADLTFRGLPVNADTLSSEFAKNGWTEPQPI